MTQARIAYFSMEIGLKADIPTYSGGLGVLAGDTLKQAADLGLPMVGVSLLYRKGYFDQYVDWEQKTQKEREVSWQPEEQGLHCLDQELQVSINQRTVYLHVWQYEHMGCQGHRVPIYFLDSQHEKNSPQDQLLTAQLYAGDQAMRLQQEFLLGVGGVELLKAQGFIGCWQDDQPIETCFHLNEGHAAFVIAALAQWMQDVRWGEIDDQMKQWLRKHCVFTTHTPVAAGHDVFTENVLKDVLGESYYYWLKEGLRCLDHSGQLNMSVWALQYCGLVNGVAKRHGEVARQMFGQESIKAITNGVHLATWVSPPIQRLFDQLVPGWRVDNYILRFLTECPVEQLRKAHAEAKSALLTYISRKYSQNLSAESFTIGFARRMATYKRADLLLQDISRLEQIAARFPAGLQVVYSGKAHPRDQAGQAMIERILGALTTLQSSVLKIVYLENYDMNLGQLLTSGVDLWLNNPVKPLEASGTSGMKAAANGVPSLSTLDGWWVEGHIEGVTGWEIEEDKWAQIGGHEAGDHNEQVASHLYDKLEQVIVPLFYEKPEDYWTIGRQAIAFNASYFNTQRMLEQYLRWAYPLR